MNLPLQFVQTLDLPIPKAQTDVMVNPNSADPRCLQRWLERNCISHTILLKFQGQVRKALRFGADAQGIQLDFRKGIAVSLFEAHRLQ